MPRKSRKTKTVATAAVEAEHRETLTAIANVLEKQDDIIEIPRQIEPDEVEGFRYPASEAFVFAIAVVGGGRGWQRRFARLIGSPPKHIVNLSWQVRNDRAPNLAGAPAVRCAVLAKRLTDFAESDYMKTRLAARKTRSEPQRRRAPTSRRRETHGRGSELPNASH